MTSKYAEYFSEYERQFIRTKHLKYLGVCICERCGAKGYASLKRMFNKSTKRFYGSPFIIVNHQHGRPTVYDGCCYIGKLPSAV